MQDMCIVLVLPLQVAGSAVHTLTEGLSYGTPMCKLEQQIFTNLISLGILTYKRFQAFKIFISYGSDKNKVRKKVSK